MYCFSSKKQKDIGSDVVCSSGSKMFKLKLQTMINRILPSIKKNQQKGGILPLAGNRMYKLVAYTVAIKCFH